MPHLILFTRPGCHLCEQVESLLLMLESRYEFEWEIRDITLDPALHDRYRHAIPVVWLDGHEALRADRAPIDGGALHTLLSDGLPRRGR
jgi:hypothetical protein